MALGIFGGFLGVGFGHATAFLQLIFPFGGIAYLSLVDYQKVASQVSYVLATNLGFKLFYIFANSPNLSLLISLSS